MLPVPGNVSGVLRLAAAIVLALALFIAGAHAGEAGGDAAHSEADCIFCFATDIGGDTPRAVVPVAQLTIVASEGPSAPSRLAVVAADSPSQPRAPPPAR